MQWGFQSILGSSEIEACHLTPPSSGRSKGRFAPFGPPLMSNVRSRRTQMPRITADPSLLSVQARGAVNTNTSKIGRAGPETARPIALPSLGVASPGPPVRWRSAHRLCCGSHLFKARLSCRAERQVPASCTLPSGASVASVSGLSCRPARFVRVRFAKHTARVHVLSGSTSLVPGAPAPNPSIERTCLKPLRAFSPTAHVKR